MKVGGSAAASPVEDPPATAAGGIGGLDELDGLDGLLAAPPLDVDDSVLGSAARVTYRVVQRFSYAYDGAAGDLVHRLVAVPPRRHGDQRLRSWRLAVSDPAAVTTWERGLDGTVVASVRLRVVPPRLDFDVAFVVDRAPMRPPPRLPLSALTGRRLLDPTRLTAPDAALRAVARDLTGPDPLATADRCASWAYRRIAYENGVTDVTTSAAAALAGGRGVCQDHAHVMLALCRSAGVPARYVSGHLLGEGGTHAWVEVVVPDPDADRAARAVAIDPCHDRRADGRYVTVAVGRDYAQVAPTSGTYVGPGRGILVATKRVDVIGLE